MLTRRLGLDWKFAIGEVFVVAIGILIALGVENWRDQRRERQLEVEYLRGLSEDLRSDYQVLEGALARADRHETSAEIVLAALEGSTSPSPAELIAAAEYTTWLYLPTMSSFTFEELTSTGQLHLIRNRALKRRIAAHYAGSARATQWNEEYRRREWALEDRMRGVLDPDVRIRVSLSEPLEATDDQAREVLDALRERPDIEAALKDMLWVQRRVRRDVRGLMVETEELIALVDAELTSLTGREPARTGD